MIATAYTQDFELFWSEYPRRISKQSAFSSYKKAIKAGIDPQKILSAVAAYKSWLYDSDGWKPEPKHPATWLNQGCWDDEYEQPKEKNNVRQQSFTREGDRLAEKYRSQSGNITTLGAERKS